MDYPLIGTIERIDTQLNSIIDPGAVIEIIADGYDWTEGPVWVEKEKMLLFSDIPPNQIFRWTETKGAELYLTPSGYTGSIPRGGEVGSNGLILDREGRLVMCQHGDRRMARMEAPIQSPAPVFATIADRYEGKRFNSPNDAVYRSNGDLFFTDPPYGLERNADDPAKELPFQGVFKVNGSGEVFLITEMLTRPNGLAFLQGERKLVVANSDPEKAYWTLFDLDSNDRVVHSRILYDATPLVKGRKGLPDGLKVDGQGIVFATGPGGVFIMDSDGKLLGMLQILEACSNVALADGDKTLYITADRYVLRLRMRT